MPWNKLYFALDLSYGVGNLTLSFANLLVKCVFEQGCKLSTFHSLMNRVVFMIVVTETMLTFELFTHETVMSQRLVVMEPFLAFRRTVVRGYFFLNVSAFSFRSMQISIATHTVGFLILNTVMLSLYDSTIGTCNFLWLPLAFLSKFKLSIVFPLVLARVSHHVFVGKDREFLLPRTHVNCIELRLIKQEIFSWKTNFPEARKGLRKGSFEQKHAIRFGFGLIKVDVGSSCFEDEILSEALFDACYRRQVHVCEIDCCLYFEMVLELFWKRGGSFSQRSQEDLRWAQNKLKSEGDIDPLVWERSHIALLTHLTDNIKKIN